MEHKCSRKYSTDFRKKLVNKFDKLKSKNDYISIYNIIVGDIGTNFSSNRNGIFINMNILSNNCIDKLLEFINGKLNYTQSQTENENVNYSSYKIDEVEIISEIGHKLSNQEKNIIKRIRNKVSN
jgi:predicted site-specific integrase-resolvase